jgi:WD40 repeat protein
LASASLDRTLRIWDVQSGKSIVITQDDWVWDVAFSPDERWLASAGADRTVRLWYTHVEELAASVATRLERDMTPTEWQSFVGEDIPYEQTRAHSSSAAP